ncbi:PEP-CTERM sorting domain-containing protein [Telluria beijingensis]|uniref:PEP-CTERM sorting domain-containing protein n=1 Tax=Telluria beijingensis TaxID=3068633 RepID=UPI002796029A|nr:PEP-CTERM sorting domain-containing protein [Massilia sp. REN29]
MKATRIALAIAAIACTLSAPVVAAPITLNASLDGLLSNSIQNGRFDASEVLKGNYKINSLSFSFSFADNDDAISYGAPSVTDYQAGNYTKSAPDGHAMGDLGYKVNTKYFSRNATSFETVTGLGKKESVSLSLAGVNVGSGSTKLTESTKNTTSAGRTPVYSENKSDNGYEQCGLGVFGNECAWQTGTWNFYTDNVKTQTTTNTSDWTGNFDISGSTTNQSIIDQLLNNKYLDFGLDIAGDLYLTGAQIDLDVTEIAAEVPEPSTVMLMLAALGGLGYSMRRRSAKQ